jgi:hypothetical protein
MHCHLWPIRSGPVPCSTYSSHFLYLCLSPSLFVSVSPSLSLSSLVSSHQIPRYTFDHFHSSTASYLTFFFLDILFLHHKLTSSEMASQCQLIFDQLNQIQAHLTTASAPAPVTATGDLVPHTDTERSRSGHSHYIFETHPSTLKLLTIATALLCHPFQRDAQVNYLEKFDMTNERLESLVREVAEMNSARKEAQTTSEGTTNSSSSSALGGSAVTGSTNGEGGSSNPTTPSNKKMSIKNIFRR